MRSELRLFKLALIVGILALSAGAVAQPAVPIEVDSAEPVLLRYRFTPGLTDTYRIEIDQQLTVSGPAVEQDAETTVRMVLDAQQSVAGIDEAGEGQLQQTVTGSTVSLSVNGVAVPADDVASAMNGLTISFDMSDRGEVSNARVDTDTDPQTAQMVTLLEDSVRHTAVEFPEDPVTIGDSWTQELPVTLDDPGMQFETKVVATYTLQGFATVNETLCAVIQTDLVVTLSGTFEEAGVRTSAEGTGGGSGHTYFDNAAGRMVQGTMDVAIQTELVAEGMSFSQAIEMTMNVSRL